MLDYVHALAVVSLIVLLAGTPAMGLALYLSPRITSRLARIAIVWPLFAVGVGSMAFVTALLLYQIYALAYLIFKHSVS